MEDEKKWVLTHDSHDLKKGQIYEGKELPAYLVGKAVPVVHIPRLPQDIETEKELREEIASLTATGREAQLRLKEAEEQLSATKTENEELQKANADLQAQIKALKKG